jgi:hypothetical protein
VGRRNRSKFKESELGEVGDFFSSTFGFIWDGLKIIFKLKPDDDQSLSDFIFEKLGALALLAVCGAILVAGIAVAYLQVFEYR